MPNVTQSIKENITITQYAEHIGLHPVPRGSAQDSFKLAEHDSCVINYDTDGHQRFYWNSRQRHGSVIDFCMTAKGVSQEAAIHELRDMLGGRSVSQWDSARQSEQEAHRARAAPQVYQPPEPSKEGQRRAFAYLLKTRGLSQSLVSALVKDKQIYQDVRGNVVFVGRDYDGADKYAFYRSTLSDVVYRGEAKGGSKEVNFSVNLVSKAPERLFVCEAAIDALSVASMLEHYGKDFGSYAYLALGGTSLNALQYHLGHSPQLKTIYLCQDRDEAGNKSRDEARKLLTEAGFQGRIIDKPPVQKDFNQDLLALRAAVQHTKEPQQAPAQQLSLQQTLQQ